MRREARIWLICHLYPVFIVVHMQFCDWCSLCQVLFNVIPILFVSLLLLQWVKTSYIRLLENEKRSIWLFIYFFFIAHFYYGICATVQNTKNGQLWIIDHNAFFIYFIIFIVIFYFIYRGKQRRWR